MYFQRIPTGFIRKHGLNLPDEVTLKVPSGSIRHIKLVQFDGNTWLDKGWAEFRDFYSIQFGHVLVFEYDGESHFDVSILDMTTVEIEYPLDDVDKDECYQASETDLNGLDSNDSVEIMKGVCTSLKAKGKRNYGNGNMSLLRIIIFTV